MVSVYFKVHRAFLEKGFSAKHCYPLAAAVHVEPQVRACAIKVSKQLSACLFLDLHSEGAVLAHIVLLSICLLQKLLLSHFCWTQHKLPRFACTGLEAFVL